MSKDELIEFLKNELKIELEDDGDYLTVKVLLGDETITEGTERIHR
jgi:hypothetical protein